MYLSWAESSNSVHMYVVALIWFLYCPGSVWNFSIHQWRPALFLGWAEIIWTQFLSAFTLETLTFVQFSQDIFTLVALFGPFNTRFRQSQMLLSTHCNTISHLRAFIWYTDSWFPGTKKSPFDLVVWKKAKKVFLIMMNTKVAPSVIRTKSCFSFFNADLVRCLY